MSFFPGGLPLVSVAASLIPNFLLRPRTIGGLVANVTIEERAVDEMAVTQHPVEQGAAVTDHAFKQPARLTINCGWSNSALQAIGNPNYIVTMYNALLALQALREPFIIITGKRVYTEMLMTRLYQVTDERSENSLMAVCDFQQIIRVSTRTVTVPAADKMKNPEANAATTNEGPKNLASGAGFVDPSPRGDT